jgi:DNA-directed RNA polymerase alpha subunit
VTFDRMEECGRLMQIALSTLEKEATLLRKLSGEGIRELSNGLMVKDLPISNRSKNAIKMAFLDANGTGSGDPSVTFVLLLTEKDIKRLPGVGRKVAAELKQAVESLGLRMGMLKEMRDDRA